jgi:hypothetical protein
MAEPTYVDLDQTGAEIQAILTRAENQREVLTADRTYYVATTGSDSNDGLSSGSPFATIQKAVDVVCSLDLSIYQATIQLADGTYTAGAVLKQYVGALAPIITGNTTTPANVVVNVTGSCFICEAGVWILRAMSIQATGAAIAAQANTVVKFGSIVFLACDKHMSATEGGALSATDDYQISGSASHHLFLILGAKAAIRNRTITISGTPAFSTAFLAAYQTSTVEIQGCTFSGSATGKRYNVAMNAVVFTSSGGSTYLPGNDSGTTATGGIYA